MLHFIRGSDLASIPELAHSMFKDRAKQFKFRLGWNVSVNFFGEERDEYDEINPLFVILADENGRHEASMRMLPSVGRTMLKEHFSEASNKIQIEQPNMWECSRFCVSPNAKKDSRKKLLAAGGMVMQAMEIKYLIGVFDKKMLYIYRMMGASPEYIYWLPSNCETGVGVWRYDKTDYQKILAKSGLNQVDMDRWYYGSQCQRNTTLIHGLVA